MHPFQDGMKKPGHRRCISKLKGTKQGCDVTVSGAYRYLYLVPSVLQSTCTDVASMIGLKPWPPSRSTSNEPVSGLIGMSFFMFSLGDPFYVFFRLVSISLRSWNADDREDVGCGLGSATRCLVVVWIWPCSRIPHWWCGPDKLYWSSCVDIFYGIH